MSRARAVHHARGIHRSEFLYAVQVDTSLGFELCPADVCEVGDANCPVGTAPIATDTVKAAPRFRILPSSTTRSSAPKKFLTANASRSPVSSSSPTRRRALHLRRQHEHD